MPATRFMLFCTLLSGSILNASPGTAQDSPAPVKKLFLPGESFLVEDRPAFILWPPEELRQNPQPWIMYGPTLSGTPDSHETWMHEKFLAAGVAVAGIDAGEAYGGPQGRKLFTALYQELTQNHGFATRVCLLGRSRGGLWVSGWAISNPDKVAGIAGIYPVFDLSSYPGLQRAASAYNLTPQELEASLDQHNPVAKIDVLAKAQVPVFIIHGDVDTVVPLKENSAALRDRYRQAGAEDLVTLIVAEGQGHNYWPGFFRCRELIDFAIRRARSGSSSAPGGRPARNSSVTLPPGGRTVGDLEYSQPDSSPLRLDLYLPQKASRRVPVVLWIHGGGWNQGSRDRCPATWLVEHDFAVASISYRLTTEAKWPAQMDDCRAAVRWLRAHSEQYGLDADHIGAWGGSAGGHLAALLGTLDLPADEEISSGVQAVCDWYGPSDLLTMPPNVPGPDRDEQALANSNGAKLLGGTVRDLPELARQASALHQVTAGDPPFLIMHGDEDPGVPLEQSQWLHDTLTAASVPSTLHIVKGAGHGGPAFQTPEVRKIVREFFTLHLQPAE